MAVFVATWLMVPEYFCVDGAIYTDLATVDRLRWAIVTDGAIASAVCVVQMLRGHVRGGDHPTERSAGRLSDSFHVRDACGRVGDRRRVGDAVDH